MIRRVASLLWLTLLILLLMAAAPARADDLTPEIQEMARLINAERAQAGLPPYKACPVAVPGCLLRRWNLFPKNRTLINADTR